MEKIPAIVGHANFEIQVTEKDVKFFRAYLAGHPTSLGSISYKISPDGEVLHITGGSFTIRPEDLGLRKADVGRLERILLQKAEKAVFKKHQKIKRVMGQVFDTARGISFSAGDLLSPQRGKTGPHKRIRFGVGKRLRHGRRL